MPRYERVSKETRRERYKELREFGLSSKLAREFRDVRPEHYRQIVSDLRRYPTATTVHSG